MAETVQVNLSFKNTLPAWMGVSAAGAVLVAAVLATVVINVGWAESAGWPGNQGMTATYALSDIDMGPANVEYREMSDGEADGVGLITTAYIVSIVGLALGFLAIPILMAGTLMEGAVLRVLGAAITGLAALSIVLATVLGPIGIRQFHDDTFGAAGGGFSWGAGLILAIIAGVFGLAATVAAVLSLRSAPAEA